MKETEEEGGAALKKLVMLAAVLAMVLAVVVPAIAADRNGVHNGIGHRGPNDGGGVSQQIGNEDQTGNVDVSFSVMSTGDNSNQCVTPLQFGNTGSNQNAQGFLQYASTADDLQAQGGTFSFTPTLSAPCEQTVQQSSAASSN